MFRRDAWREIEIEIKIRLEPLEHLMVTLLERYTVSRRRIKFALVFLAAVWRALPNVTGFDVS